MTNDPLLSNLTRVCGGCLAGRFWIRAYLVVLLGGLEFFLVPSPAAALAPEGEEIKQSIATDTVVKR